jgi:hypothetical protein
MDVSNENSDRECTRVVKEPLVGHSCDGSYPPELWINFREAWRRNDRSLECDRALKNWFRNKFLIYGFNISQHGHITQCSNSFSFLVKDEELCILPAYIYISLMRVMSDFVRTASYISVNSKFTYL